MLTVLCMNFSGFNGLRVLPLLLNDDDDDDEDDDDDDDD